MKLRVPIIALAVALMLCATIVRAQAPSTSPVSPLPPMGSSGSSDVGKGPVGVARGVSDPYDPQPYDPSQVLPDNNTLAGAQPFTLGSLEHARNIFDPSISISEVGQNVPDGTGKSTALSTSMAGGSLAFDRFWSVDHLTISYNGGETFIVGPNVGGMYPPHSQFHDLIVTEQMDLERWHILLRDDFMVSPGAAFTGTGMGGPGLAAQFSTLLSSTLNSFSQVFVPGETIETGSAQRYRNSVLGQAEYSFSRRTALTFSASYGLLDFSGAGFVNSHVLNAQAGYDYLLDPANSVGILAGYGKIDYNFTPLSGSGEVTSSTTDYMGALAYGRKITGRIAFQAEIGPERIHSMGGNGDFGLWFLTANSALSYGRRRGGVSFSYSRGLSAGSGVFLGATSNTFSAAGHYEFTRFWTGSVSGGYALNDGLAPAGVTSTSFKDWFIGANLGRQLGQHARFNFNYGVQKQENPANCPVASCGFAGFQQTFGVTVNWHLLAAE